MEPFSEKHILAWQRAVDRTTSSPGPTSGPEYGSSMDVSWNNTFIFESGALFMPFSRRISNQLRVFRSINYVGAQINSLLGIESLDSSVFDRLAQLPDKCVITLHLPLKIFKDNARSFHDLGYEPAGEYDYHMIPLRGSYDEWFDRKIIERRFIRKAERERVEIRFGGEELLTQFYEVYQHSVRRWQSKEPKSSFHRLDRMQRLFTYPGGLVEIALAFKDDTAIAGAVFAEYDKTAAYLLGGQNYEYQQYRPMFLIHARIIKRLTSHGISLYSHGLSLGRKSLEHFKESLGAERCHAVIIVRNRFRKFRRLIGRLSVASDLASSRAPARIEM